VAPVEHTADRRLILDIIVASYILYARHSNCSSCPILSQPRVHDRIQTSGKNLSKGEKMSQWSHHKLIRKKSAIRFSSPVQI